MCAIKRKKYAQNTIDEFKIMRDTKAMLNYVFTSNKAIIIIIIALKTFMNNQ